MTAWRATTASNQPVRREGGHGLLDIGEDSRVVGDGRAHGSQHAVFLFDAGAQQRGEIRIEQIAHPQAEARGLIRIGRADAALRGADLLALGATRLALGIEHPVIGEHHVRAVANEQPPGHFVPAAGHFRDFGHERHGVEHHAVADYAALAGVQNP